MTSIINLGCFGPGGLAGELLDCGGIGFEAVHQARLDIFAMEGSIGA